MSKCRALITALLLPLLLITFTSCGKSDAGSKGSTGSSSSPEKSADHLDLKTLPEAMLGAMQDKSSAHVSMKGSGQLDMDAAGDMSFGNGAIAMSMKMKTAGQEMEMRIVDGTFYMTMPGAGGKFVKLGGDSGPMAELTKQFKDLDPKSLVDEFGKSAKSVKHVGSETIDGDKTEHYSVVVDATKSAAAAGQTADPSLKNVTTEIYLNKDNTPRRITTDVSGLKMVMDYTDWGKPVTVKAPDASQIVELPSGALQ